jgi:hypothetical protein
MKTMIAIPRIDKDGTPILFLPDIPANPGMIVCYQHIGQHSEASLDYYRRDTKPDRNNKCADLIAEYDSIPEPVTLVIRKRR